MLTDADIKNLQALYKTELGRVISREEALEQGLKLVGLLSNVYKPMTQNEYNEIEEHRNATASEVIKI